MNRPGMKQHQRVASTRGPCDRVLAAFDAATSERTSWARHRGRSWRSRLVALFGCVLAAPAFAATWTVTAASDDGTGQTAGTLSHAIVQANAAGGGRIVLGTDVTLTGVMKAVLDSSITLQSDGTRRTISGGNGTRPLFVKSGAVTIRNLDLANGRAKGGDAAMGGGGGAGLGGALFVYAGTVTVENVNFAGNVARGGTGEGTVVYGSGGGGMFGNSQNSNDYGGGGLFGDASGSDGGYGGLPCTGCGGGTSSSPNGGFGGGGFSNNESISGKGGFGGGGGGFDDVTCALGGSDGGFGGGGGSACIGPSGGVGGNGGFGGGGGRSGEGNPSHSYGGFGGANGLNSTGTGANAGSGAGFGGAIFVRAGMLILRTVSLGTNSADGGLGLNVALYGKGKGGALFVCQYGSDTANGQINHASATECAGVVDATASCGVTFGTNTASDAGATAADNPNSFGPLPSFAPICAAQPLVTTGTATGITATGVTLGGTVDPNTVAVAAISFDYGTTTAYGSSAAATPASLGSGAGSTAVSATLGSLACNTRVYYRLKADGIYGTGASFLTGPCTTGPLVTTNAATAIGVNGATLNGSVTDVGANVTISFAYGTTASYGTVVTPDSGASITAVPGSPQTVTPGKALTGLACGTLYHFHAQATDGVANAGADQTFTTGACASGPVLETPTATSNSANLSTFSFQADTDSTLYFNVIASTGTCPVAATIAAHTDAAMLYWGSAPLLANTAAAYTLRNLVDATSYKLCATAKDSGDLYSAVKEVAFSTVTATDLGAADIAWNLVGTAGFSPTVANGALTLVTAPDGAPWVVSAALTNETFGGAYIYRFAVQRWDGAAWVSVGGSQGMAATEKFTVTNNVHLAFAPDGTPYVAYSAVLKSNTLGCSSGTSPAFTLHVKKWDGSTWVELPTPAGQLCAELYGGPTPFVAIGPDEAPNVAYTESISTNNASMALKVKRWDGTAWSQVGGNVDSSLATRPQMAFAPDGTLDIAWLYNWGAEVRASKLTSSSWGRLGSSIAGDSGGFFSLAVAPSGTQYLFVKYRVGTDVPVAKIYGWSGSAWTSVGDPSISSFGIQAGSATVDADSRPVIGYVNGSSGNPYPTFVKRWTGTVWSAIGASSQVSTGTGNTDRASLVLDNLGSPFVAYADGSQSWKVTVKRAALPGPAVTTGTASAITATGATLGGTVLPNGFAMNSIGFEYGLTASYGATVAGTPASLLSTDSSTAITATLSGLAGTCNTGYHFRLNGTRTDTSAVIHGSDATFATSACTTGPTVTTNAATSVTSTGATLNASVTDVGKNVTSIAFEYGTATGVYGAPVAATPATITATPGTPQTVNPTKALTGLTCNTTYYYRVKATDGSQTNNGSERSFLSAPCTSGPVVTTGPASAVTRTSATLSGAVTDVGKNVTSISFEYGLTNAYGATATASVTSITATPGTPQTVNPTAAISGLNCGTVTYHFRLKATDGTLVNGSDQTFTTDICNAGPVATIHPIAGTPGLGHTLTGTYGYSDAESDAEDTSATGSQYTWKRGSTATAATAAAIPGASGATGGDPGGNTHVVVPADRGQYLFYCVTPKAQTGSAGTEACSAGVAIPNTAITLTVTTNADPGTVGGCVSAPATACSLRDAIATASSSVVDTVDFNLPAGSKTIVLGSELGLAKSVTIDGSAQAVSVSGNDTVRVFAVSSGTVTLAHLTVTQGRAATGAGLSNAGGTVTLRGMTFSANTATGAGGALAQGSGTLTVINTSFAANAGTSGASLASSGGTVTVLNASFAGSAAGGDIARTGGTLTLTNTIVDNATLGCSGTIGNGGHNLDRGASCGFGSSNGSASNTNPRLGSLGAYGGDTATLPLLPGSQAIGAGDATVCADPATVNALDQRGIVRHQGTVCDSGAFESQGFVLTSVAGSTPQSTVFSTAFAQPLAVTVTATAAVEPVAGGVVTYTAPVSGPSATLATSPATISCAPTCTASVNATANATTGGYAVTASATGSSHASFSLTNTTATTTTTLGASPASPSVYGTAVTLTATVVPVPTGGTVAFSDGGTGLAGCAAVAVNTSLGTAQCVASLLPAAVHSFTARYGGNGNYTASDSVPVAYTVERATPTIAWSIPAPITYGTALGASQLNAGTAVGGSFAYTPAAGTVLTAGSHTLNTVFTPSDGVDYNSSTASVPLTVNRATPTVVLHASPAAAVATQPVTITATVSSPASPATGSVVVSGGGQTCTATLTNGSGSCSLTYSSIGNVGLTGVYSGDSNLTTASGNLDLAVDRIATSTTLVSNQPNPALTGQGVTVAYTVTTPVVGRDPEGNVTVNADTGESCTATVAAGSCTLDFLAAGYKTLTAVYAGTGMYAGSSSAPATQQVDLYVQGTAPGGGTITVRGVVSGGTIVPFVSTRFVAAQEYSPPALLFPFGLFAFEVTGLPTTGAPASITFTLTYPAPLPAEASYWKYGRTAGDPNPHWYVLPTTIRGNEISFTVTDGGLGDSDLAFNGAISDPGGPAFPVAVPTLAQWALWLLSVLLALSAATSFPRRARIRG